jgi:preprotein translocase subunit SecD
MSSQGFRATAVVCRRLTLPFAALLLVAGCGKFSAEDATTRVVFRVRPVESDPDAAAPLTAIQRVIEQRLRESAVLDEFVIETESPDEIHVLTGDLTPGQVNDLRELATRPGTLEFAILANPRDHAALIAQATSPQPADQQAAAPPPEEPSAVWVPLEAGRDGKPIELGDNGDPVLRDAQRDGKAWKEVLVIRGSSDARITSRYLSAVHAAVLPDGLHALQFRLNSQGAQLMHAMTANALPAPDDFRRRMAILLDGSVHAAPSILDPVSANGIVGGDYTKQDVERTALLLNAGSLHAPVEFVETQAITSGN